MARIADATAAARRVLFAVVGTSAPLAADAAYRLTTLGIDATFPPDAHVHHVSAQMLYADDLCIAISHTGSTIETLAGSRLEHIAVLDALFALVLLRVPQSSAS